MHSSTRVRSLLKKRLPLPTPLPKLNEHGELDATIMTISAIASLDEGDRGDREGQAANIYRGVQTKDREGGRCLQGYG